MDTKTTIILAIVLFIELYLFVISIYGILRQRINIKYLQFIPGLDGAGLKDDEFYIEGRNAIISGVSTLCIALILPVLLLSAWISIVAKNDYYMLYIMLGFIILAVATNIFLRKRLNKTNQ